MAAKPKTGAAPKVGQRPETNPTSTASLTLDERLHRIEALHKRIDGYIRFMCEIVALAGTSGEVKERAVAVFYNEMVAVEKQLGRIHDEFRLE